MADTGTIVFVNVFVVFPQHGGASVRAVSERMANKRAVYYI